MSGKTKGRADRTRAGSSSSAAKPAAAGPLFFAHAAAFRAWLEEHASTRQELIVGYHKVDSGRPSMTWPESVDEALCHGWIDGLRKRIDDHSYQIRFTPRRPGSIWSKVNIANVERLIAEGRMQPEGMAAYARRRDDRSGVYTFEQNDEPVLSDEETRTFKRRRKAWSYWEALPPGYRQTALRWVRQAKRAETRARRLAALIDACAEGRRMF